MKTKLKKEWYGRLKSTEELHNDSKVWLSEIDFINDEMLFLENLLSSNYIDCVDAGLTSKVEKLILKIANEKQSGKVLYNSIKDHEIILDGLIEAENVTNNKHYLHTHQRFEHEMDNFLSAYKKLKRAIFDIAEAIMKKREQKKIALK